MGNPPFPHGKSSLPLASTGPLHGSRRDGEWLRAEYLGRRTQARPRPALVELSSTLGGVVIQVQLHPPAGLQ